MERSKDVKKVKVDYRLIIGFVIAHILMYLTFQDKKIFWYMFTATMLILISYAILNEKAEQPTSNVQNSLYGIFSGILLFIVFWLGDAIIELFHLPFEKEIFNLYKTFAPVNLWHYIVLLFIIVPGEEIFWRGYIQKRISYKWGPALSIVIATVLYASIQVYSGYVIHIIAALFAGIFWGALYSWKKSMPLNIISHFIFDLCIFILFPLR
jgi:uncharacterized protein